MSITVESSRTLNVQQLNQANLSCITERAPSQIDVPRYLLDPVIRQEMPRNILALGPSRSLMSLGLKYLCDYNEKVEPRFGVIAVSMLDRDITDALKRQDCLYTCHERGNSHDVSRVIGSIVEAVSPWNDNGTYDDRNYQEALAYIQSEQLEVALISVTTAGYYFHRHEDGNFVLDRNNPNVLHDLENPLAAPKTPLGFIRQGLRYRHQNNMRPFPVITLENLADNGLIAHQLLIEFATEENAEFANYVRQEVICLETMIDCIAPGGPDAAKLEAENLHYLDEAGVVCAPERLIALERSEAIYRQAPCLKELSQVGVLLLSPDELARLEETKLLKVNGLHLSLGVVGATSALGLEYVHQAVGNSDVRDFSDRLLQEFDCVLAIDETGTFPQFDTKEVLRRFDNNQLQDKLERVGRNSAQKMERYIQFAIEHHVKNGSKDYETLLTILALWWYYAASNENRQYILGEDKEKEKEERTLSEFYSETAQALLQAAKDADCRDLIGKLVVEFSDRHHDEQEMTTFGEVLANDSLFIDRFASTLHRIVTLGPVEALKPLH